MSARIFYNALLLRQHNYPDFRAAVPEARFSSMSFMRRACLIATVTGSVFATAPAVDAQTARCNRAESVRRVSFSGSPRYDDATLATTVVTTGASLLNRWFGVGNAPCADSLEIRRDALRLAVMHRSAGWFQATVQPIMEGSTNGFHVHFAVTAGREAILDTVVITGLPEAPDGRRSYDLPLRALEGRIFDRAQVDTTIESVLLRLRNVGFARARRPENTITIDTAQATVRLNLNFDPGPRLDIGNIHVTVQGISSNEPKTDSTDVMRLISLRPGQRYRADQILNAQRSLYRTEAYRVVLVDTLPADSSAGNDVIDLRIAVAEARTRSARAGFGWATQDCIRFQSRLTDRSFLGVGRRVEFAARASKLGVGEPVDFAPSLCSRAVREDPFSERLNYHTGVSVSNHRLFGLPLDPTVSVYSERRGEPFAYLRETTIGALAEVSKLVGRRTTVSGGFQYENGRTISDPLQVCSRFGQCTPEDISQSLFGRGVSILSVSGTHDRTNEMVDPSRGTRFRTELRAGETSSPLVSSLQFYRASGEAAFFTRALGGVIGARVQIARAFARGVQLSDGMLIPPQERLFGGGQSSVRGYQQNLLGPLIYQVNSNLDTSIVDGATVVQAKPGADFERAVPRGGTALTVMNLEYRKPFQWLAFPMQFAAFVDAGNVWEARRDVLRISDLRATPGVGIRVVTPVGPFRVDIGYRPYEASAGRAFYFEPGADGETGRILCVSPGNTINADPLNPGNVADCPATYRPPSSRGVLSRLAFHFGLGQAF